MGFKYPWYVLTTIWYLWNLYSSSFYFSTIKKVKQVKNTMYKALIKSMGYKSISDQAGCEIIEAPQFVSNPGVDMNT